MAFHHDLPRVARLLPIPRRYEAQGVRRYGFHGLSYEFLMEELARMAGADVAQGRVVLAHLGNGGSITAPDGQVILAAGTKVYLEADNDPALRGLIVEVDGSSNNVAWNQVTGQISTPRGNTTLVGFAVNQDGRISATTSVSANGSIRLEAARVEGGGPGDGYWGRAR